MNDAEQSFTNIAYFYSDSSAKVFTVFFPPDTFSKF